MIKITDPSTVTQYNIVNQGVFVNYIGKGLGAGKVGLVTLVGDQGDCCIQWSTGGEGLTYASFTAMWVTETNMKTSEFYLVN